MSRVKSQECRLALRGISGQYTMTDKAVAGWWRLAGARWSFMSNGQRDQMLAQAVGAWAQLAGATAFEKTRIHLRVTTRPYPAKQWASDYHAEAERRAQIPSMPAWDAHLKAAQRAMHRTVNLAGTEVYIGVDLAPRSLVAKARKGESDRDRRRVAQARAKVEHALAASGLSGTPLDGGDLQWLVHRSAALHLPPPRREAFAGEMGPADMFTFTDGVDLRLAESGLCMRVTTKGLRAGGEPQTRYVAVLSMGRPESLSIPGAHEPYLAYARRLPFPVEISVQADVLTGTQARKAVQRKLDIIRDQIGQRHKHDLDMPPELDFMEREAIAVRHRMEEGDRTQATEIVGPIRFAVSGESEDEVLDRVLTLQDHYADYRIPIEHPGAQAALLNEFIPGEASATPAHTRHMPLDFWVAGVPTLDSTVGTPTGMYLGPTVGASRRPVLFDTHHALYNEQTGLTPIIGELGSGKSALMGKLIHGAALRGITCTVLDPSGTLARLTYKPDLAPMARHIDLTSAPAGTLNPFNLIPLPTFSLGVHESRETYQADLDEAWAARRALAEDILKMLLPPSARRDSRTDFVVTEGLSRALTRKSSTPTKLVEGLSLDEVVDAIGSVRDEDHRAWAKHIAAILEPMRNAPLARLLFSPGGPDAFEAGNGEPQLLVFTMQGLTLPPLDSDPSMWTTDDRLAVPLLHLAAQLATRRAFTANREAPKLLALDEALALDTPLPTPSGWTTMGAVEPGDQLIGADGLPVTVLGATEVMTERNCYRVTFGDGTSMVASGNHQWAVRQRGGRGQRVLTTEDMYFWKNRRRNGSASALFRVPVQRALKSPEVSLPVDPYIVGLWLGNGTTGQGYIACHVDDHEFFSAEIGRLGEYARSWPTGEPGKANTARVSLTYSRAGRPRSEASMMTRLRDLGVLHDKHVPPAYLRGSYDQRLALLQGLMDSDGSVAEGTAYCTFVNARATLVDAVIELTRSLGLTPRKIWIDDDRATSAGGYWKVHFTPYEVNPFRLPRKRERAATCKPRSALSSWVSITSIEPVESVPVRCVQVDAPDHLFVAGDGWKVTHNCHFLSRWTTGRALLGRVTRDSRKHRLRVLAASQLPQDVLGHQVGGLTNEVFIGRIEDPDAQAAALQMLRVPQGAGYEAILGGLSQPDPAGRRRGTRDWLIRDAAGRVERFIVDLSYDADLALALNPAEKLPEEWLGREAA
jgi:hypothetical protein